MKYIINIPEQIAEASVDYMKKVGMSIEPYTEPDRKAIEDEVWEFFKKETMHPSLGGMTFAERLECFDTAAIPNILTKYSYAEAKARYETWKSQKDEIRVGDEINVEGAIRVVTFIADDDLVAAIDKKGDGYAYDLREVMWHKTGKHYDIVQQMLDKIGG